MNQSVEFAGTAQLKVLRRLGSGAAGTVYQCLDQARSTSVAVKVLHGDHFRERFRREFADHCHLSHPNLCELGEFCADGAASFFTMELIEGTDLVTYVRSGSDADQHFDEARLRSAFRQVAQGLWALHQAGKVHRDIKPSNVLVTHEGRAVITDFGLTTDVIAGRQLDDISDAGTVAYMSPEQSLGEGVGTASDWYAVGTMLYVALTGVLPFNGTDAEIRQAKLEREAPTPRSVSPSVPLDLDELCTHLLKSDPTERLSDAEAVQRFGADPSRASALGLGADTDSFIKEVPFVGREAELAELHSAFEKATHDHGVCVTISAAPGLGKTALVRKFLTSIAEEPTRALVCSSRCYQGRYVPFKGAEPAIRELGEAMRATDAQLPTLDLPPEEAAALSRVFPELTNLLGCAGDVPPARAGHAHDQRARAFHALTRILRTYATRRPLVLFIDDLQWADRDSLALLRSIFSGRDAPPVLLLATVRTEVPAETLTQGFAHHQDIRLKPLTPQSSQSLLQTLVDCHRKQIAPQAQARILAEARGHPLLLAELVRTTATEESGSAGTSLEDVLSRRIRGLDPPTQRVLKVVSAAAAPIDEDLLRDATGLGLKECVTSVALLHVAQLLRSQGKQRQHQIEPYHDRVREITLAGISSAELAELHASLANSMLASRLHRRHPDVVLLHQPPPRYADAARNAELAARDAQEKLAFDQVVLFLRMALEHGQHTANERRKLLLRLGDALCNAGESSEASRVYLEATEGANRAERLECQTRAISQLVLAGHLEAGMSLMHRALHDIGEPVLPTTARGALATLLYRRFRLRTRGLRTKLRSVDEIPPATLTRLDVLRTVAWTSSLCDTVVSAEVSTRLLLAALDAGEPERLQLALALEAALQGSQGEAGTRRARQLLQRAGASAASEYAAAWRKMIHAFLSYSEGHFEEASQRFAEASEHLATLSAATSLDRNNLFALRTQTLRSMGRFRDLEALLDDALRDARERGDQYQQATLIYGVGRFPLLCDDDPDTALRELSDVTWATPAGSYHMHQFLRLDARGDLALYRGEGSRARQELEPALDALFRSLLPRVQAVRVQSNWLRARLLLAPERDGSRPSAENLRKARRIAKQLAKERTGYATALAALIAGAIAYQTGDQEGSIQHLRVAVAGADACPQGMHAAAARWRLSDLVGGDEGAMWLSEARAWMDRERVLQPERIVAMTAPGYD